MERSLRYNLRVCLANPIALQVEDLTALNLAEIDPLY